jgi:hypothetical protein
MKREDQNFGYKLSLRQKIEGNAYTTVTVSRFACAKTAEEAIENLAKILNGSIPFMDIPGINTDAFLFKLDLMNSSGKNLITLRVSTSRENKLSINWKASTFHDVDAKISRALITSFPRQKHLFKGKMLEEALGL